MFQVKKSWSQPNQRGFTSPLKLPAKPIYVLLMPRPNGVSTVIAGRQTPAKSTWPQGCGMYQAATTGGATAFIGLATVVVAPGSVRRRFARLFPVGPGIAGRVVAVAS